MQHTILAFKLLTYISQSFGITSMVKIYWLMLCIILTEKLLKGFDWKKCEGKNSCSKSFSL
jgi:hypothetical protein